MDYNIKNRIVKSMCPLGVILMIGFLINDSLMRSAAYYDEKLGISLHHFNIGFHWTTLIGMAGVILLVIGIQILRGTERYVIGMAASAIFIINLCTWKFFLSASKLYMELILEYNEQVIKWIVVGYYILTVISVVFMLGLSSFVVWGDIDDEFNNIGVYRLFAIIVFVASGYGIVLKTICNQWYLVQTLIAVMTVSIISVVRNWRCNKRREKYVLVPYGQSEYCGENTGRSEICSNRREQ